jgi:hypothetical protein
LIQIDPWEFVQIRGRLVLWFCVLVYFHCAPGFVRRVAQSLQRALGALGLAGKAQGASVQATGAAKPVILGKVSFP